MKGRRTVAFGVLVLFTAGAQACGGESKRRPPKPIEPVDLGGEPTKSGERLRAVYWLSDEGLRVPALRFLDTERDEECAFASASDGDFRCFPDAVPDLAGADLFDSDCRTRVFQDCHPYAALMDSPGCTLSGRRLFELEDVISDDPRLGPDCAFSLQTSPGAEYRRIGARLRDDELVRGVAGTAEGGGRLGIERLSGEDGSGLLLGFYDFDERAPCEPVSFTTDDPYHCVATPFAAIDTYFDDDQCTGDGVPLGVNPCETPRIGRPSDEDRFYRLGKRVSTPPFFSNDVIHCMASYDSRGFEVVEPVEIDAFSGVEIARVGEGRVRMGIATSADGHIVVPDPVRDRFRLVDEELGLQCSIAKGSDGEYRCLPTLYGTNEPNLFADDQCEVPLAGYFGDTPNPDEPPWFDWTFETIERGCSVESRTTIFELAEQPFEGPFYVPSLDVDGNRSCDEYPGTWSTELFTPSREVPPDRFVRFERHVE